MTSLATASKTMQQSRAEILSRDKFLLIDEEEFCQMMISNRNLIRVDYPEAMLRGLHDANEGLHYLIEEEKLNNHRALSGTPQLLPVKW